MPEELAGAQGRIRDRHGQRGWVQGMTAEQGEGTQPSCRWERGCANVCSSAVIKLTS